MTVDILLLRSLIAVSEAGGITSAAARLAITQPTLTRRLQLLEEQLGVALVERGRHGAVLTAVGRVVETRARDLIVRCDDLEAEVAALTGMEAGSVRLGGGATAVSFVLPEAIARFQAQHPGIRFELKESGSRDIEADVVNGVLELGLVTRPVHDSGLLEYPLIMDPIVLVGRKDHPLNSLKRVRPEHLSAYALVGFQRGTAIRRIIDTALLRADVHMNVVMELRSIPAILRMVKTTGNLAFVSELAIADADVSRVRVIGLQIERELAIIERKGAIRSPSVAAFMSMLQSLGAGRAAASAID